MYDGFYEQNSARAFICRIDHLQIQSQSKVMPVRRWKINITMSANVCERLSLQQHRASVPESLYVKKECIDIYAVRAFCLYLKILEIQRCQAMARSQRQYIFLKIRQLLGLRRSWQLLFSSCQVSGGIPLLSRTHQRSRSSMLMCRCCVSLQRSAHYLCERCSRWRVACSVP